MTEDEVAIVKESWAQVLPIADVAMEQFYCRLFELDPSLARLFEKKDMAEQQSHLANAIDLVVTHLHQPEALVRPLQDLGARHVKYGVAANDFQVVGKALLATLESGLADLWTNAHLKAWTAAWEIVVGQIMIGFNTRRAA